MKQKMTRIIPAVMCSQHPDHAGTPYWHTTPFIETHHELEECYRMFTELGAQEVMWDWEGKLVDEAVVERLLADHLEYFRKKPLGKKLFVTFRVPNPSVESGYRLGRAFMVILCAKDLAHASGFAHAPLFEVILPMTERASEILNLQKSFRRLSKAASCSFGANKFTSDSIEVIPLFERVPTILQSRKILERYVAQYKKQFKETPTYLRPFCARSDPAMNSGIVPTTLAIKWALSEFAKFSKETGIPTYPIIAPGALPFRGGLTPHSAEAFIKEFSGMRTVVVQSAFRYDYQLADAKAAVQTLIRLSPRLKPRILSSHTLKEIQTIIPWFEKPYRATIRQVAPLIEKISPHVPKRRERVQHIGLFGYSRSVGGLKLPRAIGFTASCYSLGIPPELFGTGAGLRRAIKEKKVKTIESLYQMLPWTLRTAGRYFRKESLKELGLEALLLDITAIEEYLGEPLGPRTKEERQHANLVAHIIQSIKIKANPGRAIEEAAILRHSLG